MGDTNFKFSTIQSDKNIIQYRNTLLAIFKEKTDGLTSPTKSQLQTILFKAIEQHINVARREWFNKIKSNISDKSYKLDNNNNFMSWNDARPIADGGEYSSVRVFLDKYRNHGSSDIAFENNADFTNVDVTAEGVNTFNYLGTFVNLEFILESLFIECVDNDLLIKVMKLLRVPKAIDLSDNANDAEQKVLNTKILDSNNAAINHTGTVAEKMVHIEAALNYYWSDENWTEPAYNNLSAIINAHHAEISLIDDYNVSATIDMLYTDTDYKKVKQLLLKDNQHLFLHLLSPQSYIQAYGSQTFPLLDTSKTHVNDNVELVIDRDDEVAYYVKNIKDKPNPDVNSQYIESVLTLYNTFTNSEHETFFNSIPEVNPNAKNAREITYHDFSNATNTQYPYPDYYVGDNQEYAQGFTVMNEEIAFFSKDAFTPAATKSTIRDTTTADGPHQPIFTADGNGVYIASSGEPLSLVAYEKGSPEALAASKAEQGFALSSEVIAKAVTAAAALAAVADLASRSAHDNPLATMLTSYEEKTKTTLDLIMQLGVLYEKYVSPPSSNKETFNKNKTSLKDLLGDGSSAGTSQTHNMSGTTYNDNNTIIQNILSVHTDGKHVSTYLLNLASYLSESDTMFIIPDVGIYIPTAWKTDIENFISSESYQIYQAALTPTAGRTVEDAITINTVRLMPSYINTAGRVISSVFTLNSNDPINVNDKIFAQIYNNDKKTLRVMYEYSAAERSNDATKNVPLIAKNTELETIFATAKLLGQEYFNAFGTLMIEYMLQYDDISVIFSLAEYFPEIEEIIAAYYNNKFPGHEIYNYAYDLIQSGNSNFLVDNIVTQIMSSYPLDNTKYISQKDILKLVDYINQSFHAKYNTDFSKYDAVNQASIDTLYAKYSKMVGVLSKNYGIQLSGAFIDDKKRIKLTMKLPIINKDNQKISAINGVSIVKLITNNNSVEHSVEFSVSNLNDELKTKINKAFNGLLLVVGKVGTINITNINIFNGDETIHLQHSLNIIHRTNLTPALTDNALKNSLPTYEKLDPLPTVALTRDFTHLMQINKLANGAIIFKNNSAGVISGNDIFNSLLLNSTKNDEGKHGISVWYTITDMVSQTVGKRSVTVTDLIPLLDLSDNYIDIFNFMMTDHANPVDGYEKYIFKYETSKDAAGITTNPNEVIFAPEKLINIPNTLNKLYNQNLTKDQYIYLLRSSHAKINDIGVENDQDKNIKFVYNSVGETIVAAPAPAVAALAVPDLDGGKRKRNLNRDLHEEIGTLITRKTVDVSGILLNFVEKNVKDDLNNSYAWRDLNKNIIIVTDVNNAKKFLINNGDKTNTIWEQYTGELSSFMELDDIKFKVGLDRDEVETMFIRMNKLNGGVNKDKNISLLIQMGFKLTKNSSNGNIKFTNDTSNFSETNIFNAVSVVQRQTLYSVLKTSQNLTIQNLGIDAGANKLTNIIQYVLSEWLLFAQKLNDARVFDAEYTAKLYNTNDLWAKDDSMDKLLVMVNKLYGPLAKRGELLSYTHSVKQQLSHIISNVYKTIFTMSLIAPLNDAIVAAAVGGADAYKGAFPTLQAAFNSNIDDGTHDNEINTLITEAGNKLYTVTADEVKKLIVDINYTFSFVTTNAKKNDISKKLLETFRRGVLNVFNVYYTPSTLINHMVDEIIMPKSMVLSPTKTGVNFNTYDDATKKITLREPTIIQMYIPDDTELKMETIATTTKVDYEVLIIKDAYNISFSNDVMPLDFTVKFDSNKKSSFGKKIEEHKLTLSSGSHVYIIIKAAADKNLNITNIKLNNVSLTDDQMMSLVKNTWGNEFYFNNKNTSVLVLENLEFEGANDIINNSTIRENLSNYNKENLANVNEIANLDETSLANLRAKYVTPNNLFNEVFVKDFLLNLENGTNPDYGKYPFLEKTFNIKNISKTINKIFPDVSFFSKSTSNLIITNSINNMVAMITNVYKYVDDRVNSPSKTKNINYFNNYKEVLRDIYEMCMGLFGFNTGTNDITQLVITDVRTILYFNDFVRTLRFSATINGTNYYDNNNSYTLSAAGAVAVAPEDQVQLPDRDGSFYEYFFTKYNNTVYTLKFNLILNSDKKRNIIDETWISFTHAMTDADYYNRTFEPLTLHGKETALAFLSKVIETSPVNVFDNNSHLFDPEVTSELLVNLMATTILSEVSQNKLGGTDYTNNAADLSYYSAAAVVADPTATAAATAAAAAAAAAAATGRNTRAPLVTIYLDDVETHVDKNVKHITKALIESKITELMVNFTAVSLPDYINVTRVAVMNEWSTEKNLFYKLFNRSLPVQEETLLDATKINTINETNLSSLKTLINASGVFTNAQSNNLVYGGSVNDDINVSKYSESSPAVMIFKAVLKELMKINPAQNKKIYNLIIIIYLALIENDKDFGALNRTKELSQVRDRKGAFIELLNDIIVELLQEKNQDGTSKFNHLVVDQYDVFMTLYATYIELPLIFTNRIANICQTPCVNYGRLLVAEDILFTRNSIKSDSGLLFLHDDLTDDTNREYVDKYLA